MDKVLRLILAQIVIFSLCVFAQEPVSDKVVILPFKEWKENQILEAQNQVVRLSNKIQLIKTGRFRAEEDLSTTSVEPEKAALPGEGSRISRNGSDKDLLVRAEMELKRTLEGLQYAKAVGLEEYLTVYLSKFKDDSSALAGLAEKLSKTEAAELLMTALKSSSSNDLNAETKLKGSLSGSETKDRIRPPSM